MDWLQFFVYILISFTGLSLFLGSSPCIEKIFLTNSVVILHCTCPYHLNRISPNFSPIGASAKCFWICLFLVPSFIVYPQTHLNILTYATRFFFHVLITNWPTLQPSTFLVYPHSDLFTTSKWPVWFFSNRVAGNSVPTRIRFMQLAQVRIVCSKVI